MTANPTPISVDVLTQWSVLPNPLSGSPTERWQSNQALGGTASASTLVFTFYHQYLQSLAYSVSGGGTGYSGPTFTANDFGASSPQLLTKTSTSYWFDAGSWSVTNPLPGSTSSEQWNATQPTSGTFSSTQKLGFNYQNQFMLNTQIAPSGAGTSSPGPSWPNAGTTVKVSASANLGYAFLSWTGSGAGSYSGTKSSFSVKMNNAITETANFAQEVTFTVSYGLIESDSPMHLE
ncbi:MAG: hypothetical protein WB643_12360, partial [Candidatus Bathyarchaeia archaeon]